MKNQNYESLSFNILNCPSFKQQQTIKVISNSLVNQRLNIPLLQLNSQLEKSSIRPKLFKNIFEQTNLKEGSQNTYTYKNKTQIETYQNMENNRKQQSIIKNDFQRERVLTNQYIHEQKAQDIYKLKSETNRDKKINRPIVQLEQDFQIIQSLEFNPQRETIIQSQLYNNKNRIKISINNNKHRSYTIDGIHNKDNYQLGTIDNSKVKKKLVVKKLKLKIIAILVRAVLKLSKKYKLIFFNRNKALEHFSRLKKPHLSHFNKMAYRQIQQQYRNFVEQIFSKIIKLLNSSNYIKDYTDILKQQQELILDFQKQRLCFFIKLILQDLELITRKNIIPGFILHSLNLCLFSGKNTQTSQFVVNRTKFYSKTVHSLTQEQKVLIAIEFLFFTIIIPNMLDIVNQQVFTNQDHQAITQIYFISIAILITIFFTNHFKNLPNIESSNVKPVQLILKICEEQEEKPVQTKLILSPNIEKNEEMLISGDLKLNFINKIFIEKPAFQKEMAQVFSKIVSNIEALIDISNAE
ncbi:unnamed protein product [Paramecium primaurelia]|uniref:Transmembrane protein n=1 Tax=Paramecium primaurelia TaxID=5886 RepID=A0A8S1PKT4_PARPR|nr:unnamed protein product [Paramecium primaurelia]